MSKNKNNNSIYTLAENGENTLKALSEKYRQLLLLMLLTVFASPLLAAPALLSATDKHTSVALSADSLGVIFTVPDSHRAVRSTVSIVPGSGFYYYEGRREVARGNYGFGVATGAETLANYGGYSSQSLGVNSLGYIYHDRTNQIVGNDPTIRANDTVGLAVDYRGINPIIYVITGSELFYTQTLSDVTDALFIFVYGRSTTSDVQQTVNTGNDLVNEPFTYGVVDILTNEGIPGADEITLGWQRPPETSISITAGSLVAQVGDTVTLTASAFDSLGVDISASIQWTNVASAEVATGVAFNVSSQSPGTIPIQAQVLDESGLAVVDSASIEFQLNPADDEDFDGLPNGYESANGLDPIVDDAAGDPDVDGYSNLDEYLAGTDPQNTASYPGAVVQAVLNDVDIGTGVSLSADRLGVMFTDAASHHGVRSTIAVSPGSGFYYFEGHREVAQGNFGFGVATSATDLDSYGGRTDQSLGVNAAGYIYYLNSPVVYADSVIRTNDTYGIAVDYRGATPTVYVIIGGSLFYSQELSSVTDPLYILVYGRRTTAGVQQTINAGGDLGNSPFTYDVRSILADASISGADAVQLLWGVVIPQTEILISGADTSNVGAAVTLTAFASNSTGVDISDSTLWLDLETGATGSGSQFDVNASVAGSHTITATVSNEQGIDIIDQHVVTFSELDTDSDGLGDAMELQLGTDANDPDTDDDGLSDGQEVNTHGTNPLLGDTDADGVGDYLEVDIGSDPLIADGYLDSDGDGFSNSQEVSSNTDPGSPYSYPGAPTGARISDIDKHASLVLSNGGLNVTFTDSTPRSGRSTLSISPGDGWYYVEGMRESGSGNFGIGVASASAALDTGSGENAQSVGLTTDGRVRYNGVNADTYSQSVANQYYGLGVDYSGSFPVVYPIVTGQNGYRQLLDPISMTDVTDDVYFVVFGADQSGGSSISVNAGDYPNLQPFYYPAHYEIFTAGYSGAEFMGSGWGALHDYTGVEAVTDVDIVNFDLDENSGSGITLSADGLSAAYGIDEKMGMRANQGMIGEFRYFEGIRLLDDIVKLGNGDGRGFGYGVITEHGRINPYPFDPEQPSMSLNAEYGIWRNLNLVQSYNTNVYHYGFAVDYRANRPLIHVIVDNDVVRSMELPDVFTPVYPLNYGNTQGAGVFATSSNFGATPFFYDPKGALERAGISTSGFVSGWGSVNNDTDADNLLDSVEIMLGSAVNQSDSDNDGLRDGDEYHVYGTSALTADSDSDGLSDGDEVNVYSTDPLASDTDLDGLPDQFETSNGLNPNDAGDAALDPDGDGLNNLEEFQGGTNPNISENGSVTDIIVVNGNSGTQSAGLWNGFDGGESYAGGSLWATVGGEVDRYRFNPFLPGSGNYEVFAWNDCYGNRASNVLHVISHAGGIDSVEVDQDCDTGSHGEWLSLGAYPFDAGSAGYLEITDDGISSASTTYLGADAARFLLVDTNQAPVLTSNLMDSTIVFGEQLSFSASAQDAEDGDLSAAISWFDGSGASPFIGSSFVVQPDVGIHDMSVSVTDLDGAESLMTAIITVVQSLDDLDSDFDGLSDGDEMSLGTDPYNSDTDADSLLDGAEVYEHFTDPNNADSDFDMMNDAFEVNNLLDPNDPNDAYLDNDADGLTNLEEHDAGTDPNTVAVVDIIVTNGDAGTSREGVWNTFPGSESYSVSSLWATAGGSIERYRFTPTIEVAGDYDIHAWNSCYSNRATNVPHIIGYGGAIDTIAVDQDCDTGSHGEWYFIGTYYLPAGTGNYVEITDDTLAPSATTYIGADSVRFVRQ